MKRSKVEVEVVKTHTRGTFFLFTRIVFVFSILSRCVE